MKTFFLIPVFFIWVILSSNAQEESHKSLHLYKIRITEMDKTEIAEGILFEVKPSAIVISDSYNHDDYLKSNFEVKKVEVSNIDVITIGGTYPVHGSQAEFDKLKMMLNSYAIIPVPGSGRNKFASFSTLRDTVVDFDNNVYHTFAIVDMVWMAENLKVIHFRNGKVIPEIKDSTAWGSVFAAAYCDNLNKEGNAVVYGRLYNGYAVSDSSGLCPKGWHVPSVDEWTILINFLGGFDKAAGNLKESGTGHWAEPNLTLETNNTFALPGGSRDPSGIYTPPGYIGQWWMAGRNNYTYFEGISLYNNSTAVMTFNASKNSGLSVRCTRD
jgi:uncharacterized protein (TIGR02145 family)